MYDITHLNDSISDLYKVTRHDLCVDQLWLCKVCFYSKLNMNGAFRSYVQVWLSLFTSSRRFSLHLFVLT